MGYTLKAIPITYKLVDLQFLLVLSYKAKNNLLICPIFIQPTFAGINRINLYHIIRQTVPNITDPVTKRIFPYIISTHVLSQFKFIASVLTLLVGQQEEHPTCKKLSGEVLAWLFARSEVQTCIWPSGFHCHSLSFASIKSRLVLPF